MILKKWVLNTMKKRALLTSTQAVLKSPSTLAIVMMWPWLLAFIWGRNALTVYMQTNKIKQFDIVIPLKCPCAILKVPTFVLEVSYNRFTCIQGQTFFFLFSHNTHCNITHFLTVSETLRFKILLSKSLLCSDWPTAYISTL